MATERPRTLGELKASGYRSESVKDEMRRNLIAKIRSGEPLFPDILGYEETVVPQIQNAILSRHDMLFLGLRGQAKTRMLRQLVHLLDDAMPIIEGSEVNDDPYAPLSKEARDQVAVDGRLDADRLGRPRASLPGKAGDARRHDRRPDRRGRHDQARRGALPLERADHALRPDPPDQSRDLLHQRAARPLAQDPGRPVQRPRRTRHPDPRLSDPAQPRPLHGLLGQPRGLHQPRPDRHPAQGPDRLGRPDPLPADPRAGDGDQRPERLARPRRRPAGDPDLHQGSGRGDVEAGQGQLARQPGVGRLGPDVDRQPRERDLQRRAAGLAQRRSAGSSPGSPTSPTPSPAREGSSN